MPYRLYANGYPENSVNNIILRFNKLNFEKIVFNPPPIILHIAILLLTNNNDHNENYILYQWPEIIAK